MVKCGAADDDLGCPGSDKRLAAGNGSDTSSHTDLHFVFATRSLAERFDKTVVLAFVHRCVEIDDMQPGIIPEFVQLRKDI
jgi:hypothetical protein